MAGKSNIPWCTHVWNPVLGCRQETPACSVCYAARMTARFSGPGGPYQGLAFFTREGGVGTWTGRVKVQHRLFTWPLGLHAERAVIFVDSMSDLFYEGVHDDVRERVWATMGESCRRGQGHTFVILTKRWRRMREFLAAEGALERIAVCMPGDLLKNARWITEHWPLPNVWLLASVWDQPSADAAWADLAATEAAVRGLSAEPLLGQLDLRGPIGDGLSWLVLGGETGPGARPMNPEWARRARDQCQAAGVPFFYKQAGEWAPAACAMDEYARLYNGKKGDGRWALVDDPGGGRIVMRRAGAKNTAGDALDGRQWRQTPMLYADRRAEEAVHG